MNKKMNHGSADSTGSSMVFVWSFVVLYVVNVLVLWSANYLFPMNVVLGTMSILPMWAIFHSMILLSLIGLLAIPFFHAYEAKREKMLTPVEWLIPYYFINVLALYGISRFAEQFGLGLSAWYVVLALALVFNFAQSIGMMLLEKWRTK